MLLSRFIRHALLATAIVSCVATLSLAAGKKESAMSKQDMVARGLYLTTMMGCNDCHTPGYFYGAADMKRRLSGSEIGWVGPWGVVYARNLTPDKETGIGSWTTEQIVHTLRTGNTPDGRQLATIMPWLNFSKLQDDDALAIAAYLKNLPPVKHKNLDPVPPDQTPSGALVKFPPPPAWDVPPPAEGGSQ